MAAEALQKRIDDYCSRYKVSPRPQGGLPPYPAGERETRQHREWIVLYKAVSRFRRREAGLPASPARADALRAQNGLCPICLEEVGREGVTAVQPAAGVAMTVLHQDCNELLRIAVALGPSALDRLKSYAWPEAPSPKRSRAR